MPYGMCLRQIILNKHLWKYLSENFEIDVITPIEIDSAILDPVNVIDLNKSNTLSLFLKKISSRSIHYLRASKMMDFYLDNNIGENLALRWMWFKDYINLCHN